MRVEPPTKTMSCIEVLSSLASFRAFPTGSNVEEKRSPLSSSKRALDILEKKSIPSFKASSSMLASILEDSVLLALSAAVLRRRKDLGLEHRSFLCFLLNSLARKLTMRLSKSSPPRCVSPAVAIA